MNSLGSSNLVERSLAQGLFDMNANALFVEMTFAPEAFIHTLMTG